MVILGKAQLFFIVWTWKILGPQPNSARWSTLTLSSAVYKMLPLAQELRKGSTKVPLPCRHFSILYDVAYFTPRDKTQDLFLCLKLQKKTKQSQVKQLESRFVISHKVMTLCIAFREGKGPKGILWEESLE